MVHILLPAVKRFTKTFILLIISLFVLVSGVNVTLDRLSQSPTQSTYTFYNEKGVAVFAYTGDLKYCPACFRPGPVSALTTQPRT